MLYAAIVFLILVWIFGRYTFAAIRWIFLLAVLGLIGAFILAQFEPTPPSGDAPKIEATNRPLKDDSTPLQPAAATPTPTPAPVELLDYPFDSSGS